MHLTLGHGRNRNPSSILSALASAGIRVEAATENHPWPDDLELQAGGELDFLELLRATRAVVGTLCPEEVVVHVRILRDQTLRDLLYGIPCDDVDRAIAAIPQDIQSYTEDRDAFRSWFRGQWMGQADEDALTARELASAPLTAERILEYLEPPVIRDWRPIQHYVERHAGCNELADAMVLATTPSQKWRLAYAFNRRRRSCIRVIPLLIEWLSDGDRKVREESADSLGQVVLAVSHQGRRTQWAQRAGAALFAYVNIHDQDNLYFARTALGAMGYEPARPYLEEMSRTGSESERESAQKGLANLNDAVGKPVET